MPTFFPHSAGTVDGYLIYGTVLAVEEPADCRPVGFCVGGRLLRFRPDHIFTGKGLPSEISLAVPNYHMLSIKPQLHEYKICDQVLVAIVRDEVFESWICGQLVPCDARPKETWKLTRLFLEAVHF